MRSGALILLVLLGAGCPQNRASEQAPEAGASAILAQERVWTEAFKNRDSTALDQLLADGFVFTDDAGNVYNKHQYIDAVMNVIQVSQYSLADTAAKVYGSTGVVVGTWAGTMSIDGKDASGAFRFTDTFVKNGDRWQVVASQDTRLPGPPIP